MADSRVTRASAPLYSAYLPSDSLAPGKSFDWDILLEPLSQNSTTNIEIGGHTNNTGDYDYNINLSLARAESVKQFLVSKGLAPYRLTAIGYGPDKPISDNSSELGRADNRRTEIRITSTRIPGP